VPKIDYQRFFNDVVNIRNTVEKQKAKIADPHPFDLMVSMN